MVRELLAATALDLLLPEPPEHWHPVCWMGRAIAAAERLALSPRCHRRRQRLAGAALALGLPAATWWLARALLARLPRPVAAATATALVASTVSGHALGETAASVARGLEHDLDVARRRVARMVGRDTEELEEEEIIRAAIESVAENCNDGVVAPLFYAGIGGAPLALAYRAVNTLDSMIGYRRERYRDFGWAAARLDDAAGYLPARLTAVLAAAAAPLVGGSPAAALAAWRREARAHASPNAGVCEAAFAGALGVRLGGENRYHGRVVRGAVMGGRFAGPTRRDIGRATELMHAVTVAAAMVISLFPARKGRKAR